VKNTPTWRGVVPNSSHRNPSSALAILLAPLKPRTMDIIQHTLWAASSPHATLPGYAMWLPSVFCDAFLLHCDAMRPIDATFATCSLFFMGSLCITTTSLYLYPICKSYHACVHNTPILYSV